jgi:hypothetical protein
VVWRIDWKDQIGDQKLKDPLRCEAHIATCGRGARSVSKENNATICSCLAPNHRVVATMQHPRDGKIMTSKRRKLPNRRSCFLFRIEGYEKVSAFTSRRCRKPLLVVVEPPFEQGTRLTLPIHICPIPRQLSVGRSCLSCT